MEEYCCEKFTNMKLYRRVIEQKMKLDYYNVLKKDNLMIELYILKGMNKIRLDIYSLVYRFDIYTKNNSKCRINNINSIRLFIYYINY